MISPVTRRRCPPHLFSALIACALPIAILGGGRLVAVYLEEKTIHATAPRDFFIKNQGLAFQRAAARAPDILLLYGSSELIDPVPNRASDFFSSAPSGFQVCPVGKAGTNSLIILQKLGALGSKLRHRKVVISLSPSSFLTPAVSPYSYAGNFSLPAASGVLFSHALDLDLKAKIVKRMSQFPDTLAKSALLQLAATSLASGHPLDRVVLMAIWPLGKLQNTVLDLQDHFEALVYILGEGKTIPRHLLGPSNQRKAPADYGQEVVVPESFGAIRSARDAAFRARIATASEWIDLELLFRTLTDLGAQPLIVSMPIDGTLYDTTGVSRSARQVYYDRMSKLAQRYHFPLIQFEDHDADPTFLIAHREHPTPKGWTYYDRALDDFFHKTNRY
ncbi:MAG TPA: D-alanyl-lipoteichoic acid biosynthesis protein DltD [Chthoniobacterales bacterium]|nr:D-alanyl-lipoteichoic acid biosynthesis protein DltD [Chthoniobacterales bacterium]